MIFYIQNYSLLLHREAGRSSMEEKYPDLQNRYRLVYKPHARRRMVERDISAEMVERVVHHGEVLRVYPEDGPTGSYLAFKMIVNVEGSLEDADRELEAPEEAGVIERPIHVIASNKPDREVTVVITTYEPDEEEWERGYRWRKSWSSTENTWRE